MNLRHIIKEFALRSEHDDIVPNDEELRLIISMYAVMYRKDPSEQDVEMLNAVYSEYKREFRDARKQETEKP